MPVNRELIEAVRDARAKAKDADARVAAVQGVFKTNNAGLLEEQKQASEAEGIAEDRLRRAALADYAIHKSKQPGPGLVIRVVPKMFYEPARALAWAKDRRMALTLDVRAFKRLAEAKADGTAEFVQFHDEAQAAIAQDLAAALAEAEVGS